MVLDRRRGPGRYRVTGVFDSMVKSLLFLVVLLTSTASIIAAAKDEPFLQPVSHKYRVDAELKGTEMRKVVVDQDGIVYVLTSKGIARLFGDLLALDHSYRPLAGRKATDITVAEGALVYLFEDELFSPRRAGKFCVNLPSNTFSSVAMKGFADGIILGNGKVLWTRHGKSDPMDASFAQGGAKAFAGPLGFAVVNDGKLWHARDRTFEQIKIDGYVSTASFFKDALFVGTTNVGFFALNSHGQEIFRSGTRLPVLDITCLLPAEEGVWAGTTRGLFWRSTTGEIQYYAGKRWLDNDEVVSLAMDENGHPLVLSKSGLNKIELKRMTLAEKAQWYDQKIRKRHIRYGFSAELRLKEPGNVATAEMIDTDNDGTWSNYYMASQAFRFGATGDPQAKRNAWETFEALERLEEINPLEGFPSRSFERKGFKVSDVERWHNAPDTRWDWKAHTSSDEVTAHMFGSAVLYETTARTAQEKERIATFIGKIADHLIRNNWYVIDVDGKPTLWGRWNPEYVNWFPHSIVDRRLNSAEIVALLQFAHRITGREIYREKARELMDKHGYLENILSPMSRIAETKGFIHLGHDMGDSWNHSDDLLAFVTYWVLWRYAFDEDLKNKYAKAIQDHWQIEKQERNPLWNFVYASTGAADFDVDGALWTLRGFPLDMVDWEVRNSHRQDITPLAKNFREQQLRELLPPGERRMTRWNSHPFVLDGGSGGAIELCGDEFLLPYWMGRYQRVIE